MAKKNSSSLVKSKTRTSSTLSIKEYAHILQELKHKVAQAQTKAILAANQELLKLYWEVGQTIVQQQEKNGWGASTIEKLADDLQKAFPGLAGFSRANIFRMQAFFISYQKVAQAARQLEELPIFHIPWFHNIVIIQKIKTIGERLWYAQKTIDNGWSRTILEMQIKSKLYHREDKAITNFTRTLPAPHSDFAQQSFKDPYIFDFLTLQQDYLEKDVEQGLIDNIQKLLLELGKGFAFIGRQYHIAVGSKDYYLDLLFYHYKLRCFVVVELKAGEFDPRDAGQLNFYLSAVDNQIKGPDDAQTIGILLCKTKDSIVAEYALQDINKPIGVADCETALVEKLPKNLKRSLPSIEEIEAELEKQRHLGENRSSLRAVARQSRKYNKKY